MCAHSKFSLYLPCARTKKVVLTRIMKGKKPKIRIKDIAEHANVSVGTVDRVLHNRGGVSKGKLEKVMSIIDELGYTPNILAKSLASKKVTRIAVLIPEPYDSNNLYWDKPLEGIHQAMEEFSDYNVEIQVYKFSTLNMKSFLHQSEIILNNNFDGIVFAPSYYDQSLVLFEKCNEKKIPVIFIDSTIEDVDVVSYFGQNAVKSGYLAAKLMSYGIQKNSKVLILSMANKRAITQHLKNREKGFLNFINNEGKSNKIRTFSVEIDTTENQEPDKTLTKIFADNPDIKGVFVTSARVHQVAKYIKKNNRSDLFLGGYDLVGKNKKYLKEGLIDFLICQRPEDQGYKCIMAMFNYLLKKVPVNRINHSPIDIVLKENVDFYMNT